MVAVDRSSDRPAAYRPLGLLPVHPPLPSLIICKPHIFKVKSTWCLRVERDLLSVETRPRSLPLFHKQREYDSLLRSPHIPRSPFCCRREYASRSLARDSGVATKATVVSSGLPPFLPVLHRARNRTYIGESSVE